MAGGGEAALPAASRGRETLNLNLTPTSSPPLQEAACGLEGRDEDLLQQNIQLAAQLQAVTAAYEEARAQLTAAASGTSGALAAFGTTAARPVR